MARRGFATEETEAVTKAPKGNGRVIEGKATKVSDSKAVTVHKPPKGSNGKGTAVEKAGSWEAELSKAAKQAKARAAAVQTGNRISTRGGRLTYHDTPLKDNSMIVIVLASLRENAFYQGPFDEDNPQAPVCFAFSEDGEDMSPHEKSKEPQHDTCEGCPNNEWGSANVGKGKACKEIARLALMPMPNNPTIEDIEAAEIAQLNIPVTSMRGWLKYDEHLSSLPKSAIFRWRTHIWLEPDKKSQFKVCFEAADTSMISDKLMNAIVVKRKIAEKFLDAPYVAIDAETVEKRPAKKPTKGKAKY